MLIIFGSLWTPFYSLEVTNILEKKSNQHATYVVIQSMEVKKLPNFKNKKILLECGKKSTGGPRYSGRFRSR